MALLIDGARVAAAPQESCSLCFYCGMGFGELHNCSDCEAPYTPGDEDLGMCAECLAIRIARF
ncbi:hypothetical protein ACFUNF_40795 [Streptomyces sp. NPDC057291]|uniref:hypothetical protein n=1 Tax=Streptomyces sp. NPDC057291 TaxID=3346087 RepID=UPI003639A53D